MRARFFHILLKILAAVHVQIVTKNHCGKGLWDVQKRVAGIDNLDDNVATLNHAPQLPPYLRQELACHTSHVTRHASHHTSHHTHFYVPLKWREGELRLPLLNG